MDEKLQNVQLFHKSTSSVTLATAKTTTSSSSGSSSTSLENESSVSSLEGDNTFDNNNNNNNNNNGDLTSDATTTGYHSSCCPFREYGKLLRNRHKVLPPDSITFCTMAKHLKKRGCKHDQIWSSFFAMDTRNVGYVQKKDLAADQVTKILQETTEMKDTDIQIVLQNLGV